MIHLYVKEVAAAHGLKINDLCEKMGVKSRPSFSRQINNPESINMKTLIRIAEAIGCEVAELFRDPAEEQETAPAIICPHCGKRILLSVSEQ